MITYKIAWMNTYTGGHGIEDDFSGSKEEMEETLNWYADDPLMAYWLVRIGG